MQIIKFKKYQWVDIIEPTNEDLVFLKKKYKFHELDLEDCLSHKERPKIDEYEKYFFIVFHFPVYNRRLNQFQVAEINAFLGTNFIVTLHDGELLPLVNFRDKLMRSLKFRKAMFSKGTGFLFYEIISELFNYCFPFIDKIIANIKDIEKIIFEKEGAGNLLRDIMVVKRNIITLRRILLPQRSVIASLENKITKLTKEDMKVYFDDVVDKIEKLWSNLETSKEVVESLQDTNESLISYNINHVMKILTIISVILLPLNVITGFYGMNIELPLLHVGSQSFIIAGVMFFIVLVMLVFFKWKRWI